MKKPLATKRPCATRAKKVPLTMHELIAQRMSMEIVGFPWVLSYREPMREPSDPPRDRMTIADRAEAMQTVSVCLPIERPAMEGREGPWHFLRSDSAYLDCARAYGLLDPRL